MKRNFNLLAWECLLFVLFMLALQSCSSSFNKSKSEAKKDFTRNVIKQLNPQDEYNLSFHPVLKLAFAFIMTVLVLAAIIVFSLTL